MWFSQYLGFRKAVIEEQKAPGSSLKAIVRWNDLLGLRPALIGVLEKNLGTLSKECIETFEQLPNNMGTRALMVLGIGVGALGSVPSVLVDAVTLLSMAGIFAGGWIVGGGLSLATTSVSWIFSGNDGAAKTWETTMDFTEKVMHLLMTVAGVPAGVLSTIGMLPSSALEGVLDGITLGALKTTTLAIGTKTDAALEDAAPEKEPLDPEPKRSPSPERPSGEKPSLEQGNGMTPGYDGKKDNQRDLLDWLTKEQKPDEKSKPEVNADAKDNEKLKMQ